MFSFRQKVSTLHANIGVKHTASKTHGPLGFMVTVWMVFCAVVTVIIRTLVPINLQLDLCLSATYPLEAHVPRL